MKLLVQIGIVFGICLVGEGITQILPFPFPASVISMILLLVLLLIKVVKVHYIQQKADFLLKNMSFFFIPAGVALIEQVDAVKDSALILLFICFVSTFLTFGATALTIKFVLYLQNHTKERRELH